MAGLERPRGTPKVLGLNSVARELLPARGMDTRDDLGRNADPIDDTMTDTPTTGAETHATTGGAAVAGAVTGGVVGLVGGPAGAAIGAVGGAIVGAAAERIMHHDEDSDLPQERLVECRTSLTNPTTETRDTTDTGWTTE